MSALTEALFDLRVRALVQIARRKKIAVDEGAVRNIAHRMTDAEVLSALDRRRRLLGWLWHWTIGDRQVRDAQGKPGKT